MIVWYNVYYIFVYYIFVYYIFVYYIFVYYIFVSYTKPKFHILPISTTILLIFFIIQIKRDHVIKWKQNNNPQHLALPISTCSMIVWTVEDLVKFISMYFWNTNNENWNMLLLCHMTWFRHTYWLIPYPQLFDYLHHAPVYMLIVYLLYYLKLM